MVTIPKLRSINTKNFKEFVTSEMTIAIASAIVITPILQATIDGIIQRIPFFASHVTLATILIGFFIFILAGLTKGIFRAIALGFSAGLLITALTPQIELLRGRIFR